MPQALLQLAGRALLALLFLVSGYQTLSNIEGAAAYFERLAMPMPILAAWGVGLFELAGGLLLLIGWQARLAAVGLALFALVASYIGHYGQGADDPVLAVMHQQALLKDVAVAGGLFMLAAIGAGRFSLDESLTGR